jgi:hypothetical protein
MAGKGNVVQGTKCKVTSGPNKGKEGTYTIEEGTGSTWCEGDWGGTECGSGDQSNCTDARGGVQVFEYENVNGTLVHEVDGTFDVPGQGVFHGNVILDASTGKSIKTTAIRIAAVSLGDLTKSASEVERRAAQALESFLRAQ